MPRRQIAITSASVTSCADIVGLMDHPSRKEIDDRGDIKPAFGSPEIGEDEAERLGAIKAKTIAEVSRVVGPFVLGMLKDRKQR